MADVVGEEWEILGGSSLSFLEGRELPSPGSLTTEPHEASEVRAGAAGADSGLWELQRRHHLPNLSVLRLHQLPHRL